MEMCCPLVGLGSAETFTATWVLCVLWNCDDKILITGTKPDRRQFKGLETQRHYAKFD